MRRILLLLSFAALAVGCGTAASYVTSENSISKTLAYLSSDELEGRDTGSAGIEKAAIYLENELEKARIKPYFSTYRDTLSNSPVVAYNIVGYIEGRDAELKNEFVVLGAHYDHIGIVESKTPDKIANGANDNASGTTVLLEIAKSLSQEKLKRSVLVVFSLERKKDCGVQNICLKN